MNDLKTKVAKMLIETNRGFDEIALQCDCSVNLVKKVDSELESYLNK